MPDLDAQSLADTAVMIGLLTRPQAREAMAEAEDGSYGAISRAFLRKGLITSWQLERLQKGDPTGFFYGGYKVLFHLAEGTFARVYRGIQPDNGSAVAVKVLRNRFVTDKLAVKRFHEEAEAGLKLRHENIVQIMDYGSDGNKHYMIMEYVEGTNLRDFLRLRTKVSPDEALPLMLGLARGLKYSIDRGVTHRDIKGTNILISNAGVAKLVDFGLATLTIERDSRSSLNSQRTVDYSALERACGSEKGDPRSDVFFLGCVFYQMLTGQLAIKEAEDKDPLKKMLVRGINSITPLGEHRLAPDPELTAVIERMMKVDLKARYQSLGPVVNDLENYARKVKGGIFGLDVGQEQEEEEDPNAFLSDLSKIFTYYDEDGPAKPAAAPVAAAPAAPAPAKPSVKKNLLCVEHQQEIQDAFRKSFTKMGYRVILVSDAEVAAERFREAPPDVVVFDLDGLEPEAVESFAAMEEKARQSGRPFAALVLLGSRQASLRTKLPAADGVTVLSKPVKMKQVQASVAKLAPLTESANGA